VKRIPSYHGKGTQTRHDTKSYNCVHMKRLKSGHDSIRFLRILAAAAVIDIFIHIVRIASVSRCVSNKRFVRDERLHIQISYKTGLDE
jgi:hypothetical protein